MGISEEEFKKKCPNLFDAVNERMNGPLKSYYNGLIRSRDSMMQFFLLNKERKTPVCYFELQKIVLDKKRQEQGLKQFIGINLN